jgi:hypothetical protein
MSITFTSGLSKPSAILDKPGNLERPEFGTLYGFDAPPPAPPPVVGVDGAITTEASEPLTTELNEILLFEPA